MVTIVSLMANDGAYRGNGGNLIPITDSTISVTKEILTITRVDDETVEVDVYYEFYNEGEEKEMLIGFEAMSPYGDANFYPKKGEHPYISGFTVQVNESYLQYDVAIVMDSTYYKNGIINKISNAKALHLAENSDYVEFFYVYHFKCIVKGGKNIIKHTYRQTMSSSVMEDYSVDYVLTAANRWKHGAIEDFTLILDMGRQQRFSVQKSFFKSFDGWKINGSGIFLCEFFHLFGEDWLGILLETGKVEYKKTNFRPTSELHLSSFHSWILPVKFDALSWSLPGIFYITKLYPDPIDDFSKKILKNYPFALKGYVFKNCDLQSYFEQQSWYTSNESYQASLDSLSEEEQEWVLKWTNSAASLLHSSVGLAPHIVQAAPSSCIIGFLPAQPPRTSPSLTINTRTAIPMKAIDITANIKPKSTKNCISSYSWYKGIKV